MEKIDEALKEDVNEGLMRANPKFKKDKNSHRLSIGKFGKIIRLIKENKSKKVLFAGKIAKPKFSTLRLDLKGVYYMPSIIRAAKLGDAAIIKAIIKILDKFKDWKAIAIGNEPREQYDFFHKNYNKKSSNS